MGKLSVKLTKESEKLEKNNIGLKNYVDFLENRNKFLYEEISSIRNESLKSTKCDSRASFKIEVVNLHETLSKITKEK